MSRPRHVATMGPCVGNLGFLAAGVVVTICLMVLTGCGSGASTATSPPAPPTVLAFTLENGPLYLAGADGRDAHAVTTIDAVSAPSWSPDGSSLAFSGGSQDESHIYTIHADGTGTHRLLHGGGLEPGDPSCAPDGKHLAVSAPGATIYERDIAILTVADGSMRRVTTGPGDDKMPEFSHDGLRIVFKREERGPRGLSSIWVVNADGTDLHEIVPGRMKGSHPWWSPDGTKIVFNDASGSVVPGGGTSHIFVVNADGTGLRQLTFGDQSTDFHPSWSPDGSTIFFTRYVFAPQSERFALYRVRADGKHVSLVYASPSNGDANNLSMAPPN
jgi:TolB protein